MVAILGPAPWSVGERLRVMASRAGPVAAGSHPWPDDRAQTGATDVMDTDEWERQRIGHRIDLVPFRSPDLTMRTIG
jgi:hypothetical protein